ncbi:hypothetical protein WICMUC_001411 [Wickerhamomyces mucosus]|uniref:Letm1 RBD domain-containing protein n=1 Tax=Wickerhamomyces mucosus TaxID=1378264 RepID=A0A9P8TGX9_9ASCO|nr:hypothetical protein WICMUC_001411 [Wickerhamomyces mucosus]
MIKQFNYITVRRFQSTIPKVQKEQDFEELLSNNKKLQELWTSPNPHHSILEEQRHVSINCNESLPIILRNKAMVFKDVEIENPGNKGAGLIVKQYVEFAKSIIKFYRVGIQNVWRNYKSVKLLREKYYINDIDSKGADIKRRFKNSKDIIMTLNNYLSLKKIEFEVLQNAGKIPNESIINISRYELSLLKRTELDYWKLPLFSLILLVCGELTPFVVYVFPNLSPSTCVSPSILKSINSKNNLTFKQLRKPLNIFELNKNELILYNKLYFLIPNFWTFLPKSYYQNNLTDHLNYLKLDDYYLTKKYYNKINGLWLLSKNELIKSCLDRNLIDLSTSDITKLRTNELRIKMLLYLGLENIDFEHLQKIRQLELKESNKLINLRSSLVETVVIDDDSKELRHHHEGIKKG